MSKVSITRSLLDDLAMSISAKSGEPVPLTLTEMKDAVDGISGAPSLQTKSVTYTPTESAQTETVLADNGYDGLDEVNVSVGAISNTYVGTGITRRSSTDLTVSGATVTAPSGYYSASASKSVASGTAGTPTATKGTVSNHSVSITPSVTNTTGYITGSTKTGTAVTVSASELVSGSETKTQNGTYDVTNLAEIVVDVQGGGSSTCDTKTMTNSNDQATSIEFTGLSGQPKWFFVRCTAQLTRSSSYSYYYVTAVRYNGTNHYGNYWRRSNGTFYNDTTHYSHTYSNGTLTVSSSAGRGSAGGSFYNGGYELVYIY